MADRSEQSSGSADRPSAPNRFRMSPSPVPADNAHPSNDAGAEAGAQVETPGSDERTGGSPAPNTPAVSPAAPIVGRERFLPLPHPELVDPVKRNEPLRIFADRGTPVHAVQAGRVGTIERDIAGEVVVVIEGDRFHRYRRLLPTSIEAEVGDWIEPGQVIGVVGDAAEATGLPPCLLLGLQSGEGDWLDIYSTLVGLPDPAELGLRVAASGGDHQWVDPLAGEPAEQPEEDDAAVANVPVVDDELVAEDDEPEPHEGPTDEAIRGLIARRVRKSS